MSTNYYKQCKLEHRHEGGTTITTSWLPEEKAVLGRTVYLEPRGEPRTGPWKVVHVGDARMEFKEVLERSQDYKNQRKASDV